MPRRGHSFRLIRCLCSLLLPVFLSGIAGAQERVPVCAPPSDLLSRIAGLRQELAEATRPLEGVPVEVLFRDAEATDLEVYAKERPLVDEQIKNRGPDDWLLTTGQSGGTVDRFIRTIEDFVGGEKTCDRFAWDGLAAKLRTIKREYDDRAFLVEATFKNAEGIYLSYGEEIAEALANTKSDNDLVTRALDWAFADRSTALLMANELTALGAIAVYWTGQASALAVYTSPLTVLKIWNAGWDWGALKRAESLLIPFLETKEAAAWLAPLVDSYRSIETGLFALVTVVEWHIPVPFEARDCRPEVGPGSRVSSNFSRDADGWLVEGDAGPLPTLEGGEISATDTEGGVAWYWKAPDRYMGDHSGAFGGFLVFRMRTTEATRPFEGDDVVLEGNRLKLTLDLSPDPGLAATEYRIPLGIGSPWVTGGFAATAADICQVLSAVSSLRIRGEYTSGPDTGWLGLVRFGY
jgi:hypothetical protein